MKTELFYFYIAVCIVEIVQKSSSGNQYAGPRTHKYITTAIKKNDYIQNHSFGLKRTCFEALQRGGEAHNGKQKTFKRPFQ